MTGVRGGGEDGSVDGESGRESLLLGFPFDEVEVGESSEGSFGLRSRPNSEADDKEVSRDFIRGRRKAGAIGETD